MRISNALACAALVGGAALVASPAVADAPPNWGQEVKACNHRVGCYPGDGSRGSYVSQQARDDEVPGYAWEIHNLANPGNSDH